MSQLLDAALAYAAQGLPVFPLVPGKKMPAIAKKDGGRGFYDATTDTEQIRRWWKRWPRANIGVPTGAASGWGVIDIDPRNGRDRSLAAVLDTQRPLPAPLPGRNAAGRRPLH